MVPTLQEKIYSVMVVTLASVVRLSFKQWLEQNVALEKLATDADNHSHLTLNLRNA